MVILVACCVGGTGLSVSQAALVPVTPIFRINVTTSGNQIAARPLPLADGGFVVIWESAVGGAAESTVYGQRFDSGANATGAEFEMNVPSPVLSLATVGESVVAVFNADDGVSVGVFDLTGQLLDVLVADLTLSNGAASISATGGELVLTWPVFTSSVRARRLAVDGDPTESSFVVHESADDYSGPRLATRADGSFVVVWSTSRDHQAIWARLFADDDTPIGDRLLVSDVSQAGGRDVCVDPQSGAFVVGWQMADPPELQVRRFGVDGGLFSSALCTGLNGRPSLSCLQRDRFVVAGAVEPQGQTKNLSGARAFDADSRPVGSVLIDGFGLEVTALQNDGLVATWTHCDDTEAACDVFGRQFVVSSEAECPGDCDQNGVVSVDELLVGVEMALSGRFDLGRCPAIETNTDCVVSMSELVLAVGQALEGCK